MLSWSPKMIKVDRNTSELWQIVYRNIILTLVEYSVHSIIWCNCGDWVARIVEKHGWSKNIQFIEPRTDNSSLVYLLYVVIRGLSLKDLVCCTDNFVGTLGGKSHYCPHSLLGISNLRSRTHNRENIVQIMRNTTSTYLYTNMTSWHLNSAEVANAYFARVKKKVSFEIFSVSEIFCNGR